MTWLSVGSWRHHCVPGRCRSRRTGNSRDGAGRWQSVTVENGHLGGLQPGDDPDFRVAAEGLKGGVA